MQFSKFIRGIDGAVRHECPDAAVELHDHSSARWSCGQYTVSFQFLEDAYRMSIDNAGVIVYQTVDSIDDQTIRAVAREITNALRGAAVA